MYSSYFDDWQVKPEFSKEFISLWQGWLGKDNLHQLENVGESEWSKFNDFIRLLNRNYQLYSVSHKTEKLMIVDDIEPLLSNHSESLEKDASKFSNFVIPSLDCVIAEDWDYTYILWYRQSNVIKEIEPFLEQVNLCHFS